MKIIKLSLVLIAFTNLAAFAQSTNKSKIKSAVVPSTKAEVAVKQSELATNFGLDDLNFAILSKQVKSIADVTKLSGDNVNNLMSVLAPIQNRISIINTQPNDATKTEQLAALAKMKLDTMLRILTTEQVAQLGGEPRLISLLSSK
jgi:hypothetical protein